MLCPRCNNQLEDEAAFCGVCGALIKPKHGGETMLEESGSLASRSPALLQGQALAPTRYPASRDPMRQLKSIMVPLEQAEQTSDHGDDGLSPSQRSTRNTPMPATLPRKLPPRKSQKLTSWLFIGLAIIALVGVIIGSILARSGPKATPSTPPTAVVAKGQVSFLDSPNDAPGATDALKITATSLSNPPDGSQYDAWLIDTADEQILPLGSLSKSDPTTFTLSFPNSSSQSHKNLIGAGDKIEVTQEQGDVTVPSGKVVLSAAFPPLAFLHIRHLLFQFPTTPGNVGLLTGLVNETQKVNALALLLQNNSSNAASVTCIAQAMVNVIEGNNGTHFRPLTPNCAHIVGSADIGDGFGILGNNGYINTTSAHAALAASQSDATDAIRLYAKDVETSTTSVKDMITQIDSDVLPLLTDPATAAQVSTIVSLSDRAYHGFDQNGDGKIDPVVGEAGALTAYTRGQLMATLALS
jgi:hypothetical protein